MFATGMEHQNNLGALMLRNNVTVKQLADATGFCDNTIVDYRMGRSRPRPAQQKIIADILCCEPEDIWPGEKALGVNYEERYESITHRIMLCNYRDDCKKFQQLCSQRAALSVKICAGASRARFTNCAPDYIKSDVPSRMTASLSGIFH